MVIGTAATGGARISELRKERDLTQTALARRAGISMSLLSKIEVGDRALTPGVAAAIARALHISLDALHGETEVTVDQSALRDQADLAGLLRVLPGLLSRGHHLRARSGQLAGLGAAG